jgi:hypothetical protein
MRARNLQRSEAFADARSALKQAIATLADAAS